MPKFIVTIGQQYFRDPHPILGEGATPNGYLTVESFNQRSAEREVWTFLGREWSNIYTEERFFDPEPDDSGMRSEDYYPAGSFGVLRGGSYFPN